MGDVTLWLLVVLATLAAALCLVWWLEERRAEKVSRPVRVRLHSREDREQVTRRLHPPAPPPDLKYGGVIGRPRFNQDGEWINHPRN